MILVLSALLGGVAGAAEPSPSLVQLLSYIDVPLTTDALRHAQAEAAPLLAVARDRERLPYIRTRAAAALGLLAGPASARGLMALAQEGSLDAEVRLTAVSALGLTHPEGTEAVLVQVLRSDAPAPVIDAAVRATQRLPPARSAEVVGAFGADDPLRARLTTTRPARP